MKVLNNLLWGLIILCFAADATFSLLAGGDPDASGHFGGEYSIGFVARQIGKIVVAGFLSRALYSFFKNKKWSRKTLEICAYFFVLYVQFAIFAVWAVGNGDPAKGSGVWLPFFIVDVFLTGLLVVDIKYLRSPGVRGSHGQ